MPLIEYRCDGSTSVSRVAWNKGKNELIVQYKNNEETSIFLYSNVPDSIEDVLAADASKRRLINEVKKYTSFRRIRDFPRDVVLCSSDESTERNPPGGPSASGTWIEYDCTSSTAIKRVALNKKKKELVVQYRDGEQIYMYLPVPPSVENILISDASKGKLLAEIRKYNQVRKIKDFPASTTIFDESRRAKKAFNNHTSLWINVLSRSSDHTIEYLNSMLEVINRCHPSYPPARKPPVLPAAVAASASHPSASNHNAYSALDDDTDDEDDIPATTNASAIPVDDVIIQARYLRIRVICSIAEWHRRQAVAAQKEKLYDDVKLHWTTAWDTLQSCRQDTDEWYAIMCRRGDPSDTSFFTSNTQAAQLPNKHDMVQLIELFRGLEVLIHDTEREKEKALNYLHKRLSVIQRKLNPMLHERDTVKASIGEERWTHNPAPKLTYAERRKMWEEDLAKVMETISVLESLHFDILH